MRNNDVLRRLRYALDISDVKLVDIFKLGNYDTDVLKVKDMLKKEEEDGFLNVNDRIMTLFLDGFIIFKRGENPKKDETTVVKKEKNLSNNDVLKKLKIALNFHSDDIMEIMELAECPLTKPELSAVFRNKEHRNFKECGDKYIKKFLKGLTIKNRGIKDN